jgi:DNA invertase Pin-like site-specific DNA recombinase
MSKPIPAVAYYRVSTDKQEASIPAQRVEVQGWAARNGYRIVREYQDEGISGDATEKRIEFQKMLRDAKDLQDFQAILCWDQDCFGRFDPLEAGFWVKPLRDRGIYLATMAQGRIDWDDFAGRIIYAVQQEGKHAYLRDLSRNIARGMLQTARAGKWAGGVPPYGYKVEGGRLVPGDPLKVDVVPWLFTTYATKATSLRGLTDELYARGIANPRGGARWKSGSIRKLLKNRVYLGDFHWNRYRHGKYNQVADGQIEPRRRVVRRHAATEKGNWIVVENSHEALIDREIFEMVQARLLKNKKRTAPRSAWNYLLSGMMVCGHCGSRMVAGVKHGRKGYMCAGYRNHGKAVCFFHTIDENPLFDCIVKHLQEGFLKPDNLVKLKAEVRRQAEEARSGSAKRIRQLRSEVAQLDRKINQGVERLVLVGKDLVAELAGKIGEWKTRRETLTADLAIIEARPGETDQEQRIDQAIAQLWKLTEAIAEADPTEIRVVLQEFVSKNIDRLGREGPAKTLRKTIFTLWDHGITLQTFRPEETYGPGCESDPKFIVLILYLQRAWDESQRKSDLAHSNWAKKQKDAREEGRIVTRSRPAWLTVDDAGQFQPIPEAVKAIQMIFTLKAKGIGLGTIERKLNHEAPWTPPIKKGGGRHKKDGSPGVRQQTTGWRTSYLKKILTNRAVLGEYQPFVETGGKRVAAGDVIPGYFPAIVKPALFHTVQEQLAANRGKGGRTAKVNNLLAHLAKCAYCGGPMAFSDRGEKGDRWLICDNGRRGVQCARYSMKYAECEKLILDNCPQFKPEHVLPNPDEQATECLAWQQRIAGAEAEVRSIDAQTENLIDQIARTPSPAVRDQYEAKVQKLAERKAALATQVDADRQSLHKAEMGARSLATWQRNLKTLKRALKAGDIEVRMRVQAHLRALIAKVEVFAIGTGQHYGPVIKDCTGDDGEPVYWFDTGDQLVRTDEREATAFITYVNQRRATKEGRFLRVHFKDWGELLTWDLAPDDSLADHWLWSRPQDPADGWKPMRPAFERLWQEYRAERSKR